MAALAVPSHVPSPSKDAEEIYKAFGRGGPFEVFIMSILAHRNAAQRKQIRRAYSDAFDQDLLAAMNNEFARDFEVVVLWTMDPSERDAWLAFESAKKWHASDRTFIEIACTRSSDELRLVRKAYHAQYKRPLEKDVAAHTKDAFRKLLVPLVSSLRYDGPEVNVSLAKSEAKLLHSKISNKAYTDDELIRIITTRSKAQLLATFNEYDNDVGHPINKDLKEDPEDEYLAALRAIIKTITNPEKYFEKTLRLAIYKMGTDEGALTRVIITRAEVDLKLIKEAFKKRNEVPLGEAIKEYFLEDCVDFLIALVGEEA